LCEISIASVRVVTEHNSNADRADSSCRHDPNSKPPPPNLTKSIASLTDLSCFPSESFHVITCCYGYNLIDESEFEPALKEAYRVLAPGGALIVANWESSALHFIGRDVLSGVQRGYASYDNNGDDDNDSLFLPCMAKTALEPISLSSGTQSAKYFQEAMERVGFLLDPVSLVQSYPFRLGRLPELQFFLGTFIIREKLLQLGALAVDKYAAGGWSCLAEQIFFSSIRKYTVPDKNHSGHEDERTVESDGTMWLHGNTYKMSIMRK
jgi:SAM-dependent methyltransferase